MLIEIIDIFLGAFNYYFSSEDSNYLLLQQILVIAVCFMLLATSCVCLCIIVHDILKFLGIGGNRR